MTDLHDAACQKREYSTLPASVSAVLKVMHSDKSGPFEDWNVTICEVGCRGLSLSLTTDKARTPQEVEKMLARRRKCQIVGFGKISEGDSLEGQIAWVEAHMTSKGMQVRIGVDLDEDAHWTESILPTS